MSVSRLAVHSYLTRQTRLCLRCAAFSLDGIMFGLLGASIGFAHFVEGGLLCSGRGCRKLFGLLSTLLGSSDCLDGLFVLLLSLCCTGLSTRSAIFLDDDTLLQFTKGRVVGQGGFFLRAFSACSCLGSSVLSFLDTALSLSSTCVCVSGSKLGGGGALVRFGCAMFGGRGALFSFARAALGCDSSALHLGHTALEREDTTLPFACFEFGLGGTNVGLESLGVGVAIARGRRISSSFRTCVDLLGVRPRNGVRPRDVVAQTQALAGGGEVGIGLTLDAACLRGLLGLWAVGTRSGGRRLGCHGKGRRLGGWRKCRRKTTIRCGSKQSSLARGPRHARRSLSSQHCRTAACVLL